MTDYHRDTTTPLPEFRTILGHLNNIRPAQRLNGDPNYAETFKLMEELRQNLLKYEKRGSITCRDCGLVKGSHPFYSERRGCKGWNPK